MHFTVEQRYDAPAYDVLAAYTDPAMYATFDGLSRVGTPEVLDRVAEGGRVTLRLRMRFIADLSSAARRVVDPAKLTWVQEEVYDLTTLRAQVVFHPDAYADRFSCAGGYAFLPGDGEGSTRCIEGDLRIRIPLVGGQVERAMVSGLEGHFAEEQPLVARWLAAHPPG